MLKSKRLKVLVAPLDWGLGHATRCIPIINALIQHDYEVIIAAEGRQKRLFQEELLSVQYIDLPGYRVQYGSNKRALILKIISQIPKILIHINREKRWLNSYLVKERPDIVISDNRFGLSSPGIYSIFITHQLHIRSPFGGLISRALSIWNYKYINQFSACWIPDFDDKDSLAGMLAHPKKLPVIPMRYIGLLTRFLKMDVPMIKDSLVVILSGPEPQRSLFENKLFEQLKNYKHKVTFVRGLPGDTEVPATSPGILVHNHLSTEALNKVICESEFVVGRSGYSTIMDIVALKKKSILIPTPGQPEQEYLARHLLDKKIIFSIDEDKFVLQTCVDEAKKFPYVMVDRKGTLFLEGVIDELDSLLGREKDFSD